ncbi:MAG: YkgJ family cysteine cluster protein [Sporomusaceae bacterium]|nr:YkgJ family cysteine cluster protein [Sporomusaceae bacterium]
MRLFFNSRGDIDCCGLTGDSSVTELAEACLDFCGRHIDCSRCRHSCCGGLAVYPDHIFFARLEQMTRPVLSQTEQDAFIRRLLRFDRDAGKWLLAPNSDGYCRFLLTNGRCAIYEARPLVCRLHICGGIAPAFRRAKERIYPAYQAALREVMAGRLPARQTAAVRLGNPVRLDSGYTARIGAIWDWTGSIGPE